MLQMDDVNVARFYGAFHIKLGNDLSDYIHILLVSCNNYGVGTIVGNDLRCIQRNL